MYAMEYSNQERAAPAAIAIVANLILVYALAASIGVAPSPLKAPGPSEWVNVEPKPEPIRDTPISEPGSEAQKSLPSLPLTEPLIELEKSERSPTGSIEPPIKIGDGEKAIAEPFINARILSSAEPPYPLVSRTREEEGTVFVKVMISPYGIAGDVQIEKSSGYPRLDDAAMKAVRGWRFMPAKRGSQAIATWVTVPVKFVLNNRR